jgi:DNA-binding MarR family transcriptional regulator/N-acetylglutamate synthase-like GNAT family acetyltransferase
MSTSAPDVTARVRRFSRFYTELIGALSEHLLRSDYSLTEVRILYELAHRDATTASNIAHALRLDGGYLSRMLRRFRRQGIIQRKKSPADGRARLLSLTAKGRRVFARLDTRADEEIAALLRDANWNDQQRLVAAMQTIEEVLGAPAESKSSFVLRDPHPGDLGWIVHRHGVLYAQEYRYDERFEALVSKIVGEFVEQFDARRERCWIAEQDGAVIGSVFLVRATDALAKLRLLYVEPAARGRGIGERLIAECVRFARQVGYEKITLWTQSELQAARHLYEKAGFVLVREERHDSWGRTDLVAEIWELTL